MHRQGAIRGLAGILVAGLPIASPGADALHAVVEPADTDFLYFVSRNDGTHKFSRSYREHIVAVNTYQRRGRQRR